MKKKLYTVIFILAVAANYILGMTQGNTTKIEAANNSCWWSK